MDDKNTLLKGYATIPDIVNSDGLYVDGDWIESKDQDPNGDVRLIQLADIGDGIFRNKSSRFLTQKKAVDLKCSFIEKGDILVARMPDPIGRACIFPLDGLNKYVTVVDVAIIRPDHKTIETKYLLYIINSPNFRNLIEDLQSGTTRKRISRKNLSTLKFPLPSKKIQQAIVSKIEELFSEIDKGIENLRFTQQQLRVYQQAVLKSAFEGKLTNIDVKEGKLPTGWKWVKLGQVTELSPEKHKPSAVETLFYVGLEHIEKESGKLTKSVGVEPINTIKNKFSIDEILYGKLRPNLNKVYLAKEEGVCSTDILVFRVKEECYPKYLFQIMKSTKFVNDMSNNTSGVNLPRVSTKYVQNYNIPLPTKKEQKIIIEEIESRLSIASKIEETIIQSLQQAEALKQSILKKAFEGKLVQTVSREERENIFIVSKTMPFPVVKDIKPIELHAGLVSMIIDLHEKNPKHLYKLSHVKCEKISDLIERKIGISLGRKAVKDAAGPDDFPHLKKVEHRAKLAGFFSPVPLPIGYTYKSEKNIQKAIAKAKAVLTVEELVQIEALLKTFLPFELEHAELVATLFAGWNNLIIEGKEPTDEEIVYESRENWSKRKLTIEREKFFKTLAWMKEHKFVPEGKGQKVL